MTDSIQCIEFANFMLINQHLFSTNKQCINTNYTIKYHHIFKGDSKTTLSKYVLITHLEMFNEL